MVLGVHDRISQGYQHHFLILTGIPTISDSGTPTKRKVRKNLRQVQTTHTHTLIFTANSEWNKFLWYLFVVGVKPGTTNHKKWKFN